MWQFCLFTYSPRSIAGPILSFIQAYTQPYSFGGRIKIIVCQIRHELSVIIHQISTNWKKKTLDGDPIFCTKALCNTILFSNTKQLTFRKATILSLFSLCWHLVFAKSRQISSCMQLSRGNPRLVTGFVLQAKVWWYKDTGMMNSMISSY